MLSKRQIYFRRVVLAAEIASKLHDQPTFGHVKFQKLMFLCEHISKMHFLTDYCKQAAGPYDRKFMHSIDQELQRQKWFDVHKEEIDGIAKYTYTPALNLPKFERYYNNYFSEYNEGIQELINIFKNASSSQVELVATLYACWDAMKRKSKVYSDEQLIENFYDWSEEKEKFGRENVINAIKWMKKKGVFSK